MARTGWSAAVRRMSRSFATAGLAIMLALEPSLAVAEGVHGRPPQPIASSEISEILASEIGVRISGSVTPQASSRFQIVARVGQSVVGSALAQRSHHSSSKYDSNETRRERLAQTFSLDARIDPGARQVCLMAVDLSERRQHSIGCRLIDLPGHDPLGRIDGATIQDGRVTLSGWALDRSAGRSAIVVEVSFDSRAVRRLSVASLPREDIPFSSPDLGDNHGFSVSVEAPLPFGQACVTAKNVGPGSDTLLGCVDYAGDAAIGAVEAAARSGYPTESPQCFDPQPLPIDPSAGIGDQRTVFAHYFPPYPISLDNRPANEDFYTVNYLAIDGEGGRHAQYGGLLRDRPLPRAPLPGDWRAADFRQDISNASAAGIDGFFVDVLHLSGPYWDRVVGLTSAAGDTSHSSAFRIVPQLDMKSGAGRATVDEVANALAQLAELDGTYRLESGEVLFSAFYPEAKPASWWLNLMGLLKERHGVEAVFAPILLDTSRYLAEFAPISYAIGSWGKRTPTGTRNEPDYASAARAAGAKWIAPIAVQDQRPYAQLYWESQNLTNFRQSWERADSEDADMALILTWNDYSEGTSIAPSFGHGHTLSDLTAYFVQAYKTSSPPLVRRDAVYLIHRNQLVDAPSEEPQDRMRPALTNRDAPSDLVEAIALATAPGELTVLVGANVYRFPVPAGFSSRFVPLTVGRVSAELRRDGLMVESVRSPFPVLAKPGVQDLQYFGVASRRSC